MRTLTIVLATIGIIASAAPAAAQSGEQGSNYGSLAGMGDMASRIVRLQVRLQAGIADGSITPSEARPIDRQVRLVADLERKFRANGISGQERAVLQKRIQAVRKQLQRADEGAQGRYREWDRMDDDSWAGSQSPRIDANRDGWDDRDYNRNGRIDDNSNAGYSRSSRYGGWIDTNRDGWDDRDVNRTGRLDDDMHRTYEQAAPRTLADALVGGVGLQVGHEAPANLYGVPYQHQARYRDGNGVYYRSDGRRIYRIDARSNIVLGVFAI